MNKLLFINAIVVLAATTFLMTSNATMAYSCSSSSSTQHTSTPSQISGSSGSCSTSSSASTSSGHAAKSHTSAVGPNVDRISDVLALPNSAESSASSSSGGAQSSCSSASGGSGTFTTPVGGVGFGAITASSSTSQQGHCP
jgi:hypothetical protein